MTWQDILIEWIQNDGPKMPDELIDKLWAVKSRIPKQYKYSGTLYRGLILPIKKVREMTTQSTILKQRKLSSWTKSRQRASEFAKTHASNYIGVVIAYDFVSSDCVVDVEKAYNDMQIDKDRYEQRMVKNEQEVIVKLDKLKLDATKITAYW